jgi:hypothetical protein
LGKDRRRSKEYLPHDEKKNKMDWKTVRLGDTALRRMEALKLGTQSKRRRDVQAEKRNRYFLKGPLEFRWILANIPDPASRLILVAAAFMDMESRSECVLSSKVWSCAGIEGKDRRRRVLQKIRTHSEEFKVRRRAGRRSILVRNRKGL